VSRRYLEDPYGDFDVDPLRPDAPEAAHDAKHDAPPLRLVIPAWRPTGCSHGAEWAETCGRCRPAIPPTPWSRWRVTLAAVLCALAFLLAFMGARHVMCDVHDDALRYCPGYSQETP